MVSLFIDILFVYCWVVLEMYPDMFYDHCAIAPGKKEKKRTHVAFNLHKVIDMYEKKGGVVLHRDGRKHATTRDALGGISRDERSFFC